WVQAGGKVIAMESATNYFADKEGWGLKRKKDNEKKDELRVYGNREREAIMDQIPGAIYKVQVDNTHPLAYGYDGSYHALVRDAYNYEYLKDGWNVGYVKDNAYITGFGGKNAKEKMKNTLIFGVHQMGRGSVVYLTDNPLFRGFWYNGKLLFGNALFMVN
ncbi:MAG: zinc carboxypeptidase, partial [Spirosomaceae bacterium]|nr:zinc carboxypeptidase [Spirosomataceae bacterium]